jgi:hypothetical protein
MGVEKATTFDVEGIRFELRRLSVDDACVGVDALTGDGQMAKFSKLLKLFAPRCKVSRTADGSFEIGGAMVDLKAFTEDLFAGRLDLLTAFMSKAIDFEFGAFLATAEARVQAAADSPTDPA